MNKGFWMRVIICMILLISCSKSPSFTEKNLNQASQPLKGLDPQLSTGLAALIQLGKLYEPLMETHPFQQDTDVLPNLAAEAPKISSDGLVYTFKLIKGVRYHSCPCFDAPRYVRADDFVTTFKRIADPRLLSPHYNHWVKKISGLDTWYNHNKLKEKTDYSIPLTGVVAIDDFTLKIKLKYPDAYFLNELTSPITAPMALEAVEYYENDFSQFPVGTGPFILEQYIRKSRMEYKKNPDYRKKYFPSSGFEKYREYIESYRGQEIPLVDSITVHIMNEPQTQWLNFLKGKIDYLEIPKDNFSESISPQKSLSEKMKKDGFKLSITPSNNNVYYLGFNNKDKFFNNKNLRKAIAYGFDREKFNDLFFNGTADIAQTFLPPGILGNDPPLKGPYFIKDINKAKKFLELAGFSEKNKLPKIKLLIRSSTLSRQIGEFFVNEMKQVGIAAEVDMVDWGNLLEKAQKGNYQIVYLAWFVGIPNGFQFFDLLYGPNWPDSYNRMGYQNQAFDNLYEKALQSTDSDLHEENFKRMNEILIEDIPVLPLIHVRDYFVHQAWLKNYVPSEVRSGMEQYLDIDLKLKNKTIKDRQ